ncbi:MAG TPA: MarR family transcriptional regulator [Pseudonocardia sp.]
MPATLTPRQARILDFIRDHTRTVGYPPTVREIGAHAGLTATSSVHRQLEVLVAKGYLRREGNRSRAVVVIDQQTGAAA